MASMASAYLRVSRIDGITDRFGIGLSLSPVGFGGDTRDRVFTADPESIESGAGDSMQVQRGRLMTGPFR
jgi:hypothetical protein